jgi:hypothetical protein
MMHGPINIRFTSLVICFVIRYFGLQAAYLKFSVWKHGTSGNIGAQKEKRNFRMDKVASQDLPEKQGKGCKTHGT